ncbi:hypothetical protein LCGC14_2364090 [marine sediment metagenome]|uniref:Uncharacterized protein n=1 Tax=marine sediment metagenome TaxID=412755 RepID=A0A0F9C5X6_9ZZZZ
MKITSLLGAEWFDHILARRKPTPEPVDDFRDVLDDLWADREARKDAETRRAIAFDLECG